MKYIDISAPLGPSTRVYPGDPPVEVTLFADPARGAAARVSTLRMSAHAGTHVDAPAHLAGGRAGVEKLSLASLIGPAVVVDAPALLSSWLDVPARPPGRPRRVLFKGAPVITAVCARDLTRRGVCLVGTDGLSIDTVDDAELPAHRVLLKAGVIILEGLDLSRAAPGRYDLIALPLLIPGSDGAPARAILLKR